MKICPARQGNSLTGARMVLLKGDGSWRLVFYDFQLYAAIVLTSFAGFVGVYRPALSVAYIGEAVR